MAQHVSVKPDLALDNCPKCGEPYYHTLQHMGGSVSYIHSDVDILAVGMDVEYCYVGKLPTSATIDATAVIEVHGGLPQNCTLFFNAKKAGADYLEGLKAFTRDHPDWVDDKDWEFYSNLYDTGDFDNEVFRLDVEIKKGDLPYHGMALYLASSLYDVMLWAMKEEGVSNVREPKVPKAHAYTSAFKVLGKAYEEFKGYGLRNIEGTDG